MGDQDLIQALKVYREHRGITAASLSKRMGMGAGRVSAWETGLDSPSLKNFIRWADELGFTIELFGTG